MARHGENIRKRKDGRWEARYPITDAKKGRKIYQSVYGSTYEEVKEKRASAIRAAGKKRCHTTEGVSQILFSQAADQWLQEISDKRKASTYVKYRNVYRLHLERTIGACLLQDMSGQELQEKISDHLSKSGLSNSTKKSVCCVANQILGFAAREYSVSIPILKPEASKQTKKTLEVFTKQEQSRLLTCIYGNLIYSRSRCSFACTPGRVWESCVL